MKGYHLLIIINAQEKASKTSKVLSRVCSSLEIVTIGQGSASSSFLIDLGLGKTDKNVVLMIVKASQVNFIYEKLEKELSFSKPNTGIAFTIPLSAVSGEVGLSYLLKNIHEKEVEK